MIKSASYSARVEVEKPREITVLGPSLDSPGTVSIVAYSDLSMDDAVTALLEFRAAIERAMGRT